MAIQSTGKVVSYEWKEKGNAKWMVATLQESGEGPREHNIMGPRDVTPGWQEVIKTAKQLNYEIEWEKKKEEGDQFWNFTYIRYAQPQESMTGEAHPELVEKPSEPQGIVPVVMPAVTGWSPFNSASWTNKDRDIHAAVCLKEIGAGLRDGKFANLPDEEMLELVAWYQATIFDGCGFSFPGAYKNA